MNSFLEQLFVQRGMDVLAICILLVILFSIKNSGYLNVRSQKIFLGVILCTLANLILEIATRQVNGLPGIWAMRSNTILNTMLFLSNPFSPLMWLIYLHLQLNGEKAPLPLLLKLFMVVLGIHTLSTLMTPIYDLHFSIDSGNIYHRGPLYMFTGFLNTSSLLIPFFVIPRYRKDLSVQRYTTLLLFPLIPALGTVVQVLNYSITTIWSTTALGILMVFINLQNRLVNQDYLTGVGSRRQLDVYINRRIREAVSGNSFSLLMIDLNDFKSINDRFGHQVGDRALEAAALIIRSAVRKDDFVGRYAGDEFITVLQTTDELAIKKTVIRLKEDAATYNRERKTPYSLDFSIGYTIYDPEHPESLKELQEKIDTHMYQDKKRKA